MELPENYLPGGAIVALHASAKPDVPAVIGVRADGSEHTLTWSQLDARANQVARAVEARGVRQGSHVVLSMLGSEHFVAILVGLLRVGARLTPLRGQLPLPEREGLLNLIDPVLVISDWDETFGYLNVSPTQLLAEADVQTGEHYDAQVAKPYKAMTSGGSTGRPKLILDPNGWGSVINRDAIAKGADARAFDESDPNARAVKQLIEGIGIKADQVHLVVGAMYHNGPFSIMCTGLLLGQTIVITEHFDPEMFGPLVERHKVGFVYLAPVMMQRIARAPGIDSYDLSSLQSVYHTAAPCPPWLKRRWFELVAPSVVNELYGATEGIGHFMVRGDGWLSHEGTVGRPVDCEVAVFDDAGRQLPPGEIGEVYMRSIKTTKTYEYVGSDPLKSQPGGWLTVGDLGHLDDDGYLYLADRRTDMIVTGGANVFPSEVERVLSMHTSVADVVVIGPTDEEWGRRIHAVIQPLDPRTPPSEQELDALCREHLASYKAPKGYTFVAELPRTEAGKLNRMKLQDDLFPPYPTDP